MKISDCVRYLDELLKTKEIQDESSNGLQVDGSGEIIKIGFAVDATELSFARAAEENCNLLIVHHGLFWKEPVLLIGPNYSRVKILMESRCGLYASHLPLDLHPELGNNIQICRALSLQDIKPFGKYHGIHIGYGGELPSAISPDGLIKVFTEASGSPLIGKMLYAKSGCKRIAVVSGGAPGLAQEAALEGYDTYLTGDVQHWTVAIAREYGINILSGGHYATETFGVKALMKHMSDKFNIDTVFIDVPTGF